MRKVIVNFSGGKDSTAAILETLKRYPKDEITLCYQDTGAEYLETEGHVQKIATQLELPLIILKRDEDFWGMAKRRKFFPTPGVRWCTSYLKRDLLNKWITRNFRGTDTELILVTGIRGEESRARSRLHEWEEPKNVHIVQSVSRVWYPCIDKKEVEVKEQVIAEGLELHPCYEFARRCGCWCCIFAPVGEVREYAERNPELYGRACLLEDEIKNKWKHRLGFNDLMKQLKLFDNSLIKPEQDTY